MHATARHVGCHPKPVNLSPGVEPRTMPRAKATKIRKYRVIVFVLLKIVSVDRSNWGCFFYVFLVFLTRVPVDFCALTGMSIFRE